MEKMGICEKFIGWVKLLFDNASALVNLNGSLGEDFKIEKGVRQGRLLAPYLFLIVGRPSHMLLRKP